MARRRAWNIAQNSALSVFPASNVTCTSIRIPENGLLFIPGNLNIIEPLQIPARSGKKISIAVLGNVRISSGVSLQNLRDTAVEIIAAGSIYLSGIRPEGAENISVLLHAANGKVDVPDPAVLPFFCGKSTYNSLLQLRAEAAFNLIIGGERADEHAVGCDYYKESPIWTSVKILGEYVSG